MKKIKVLHFVNNLVRGGVLSVILNYYSILDHNEFEFSIVYIGTASEDCLHELQKNNIKCYKVAERRKNLLSNFFQTIKIIKNQEYDVIHSHLGETSFIPLFIAKKYKVPIRIAHSHNYDNDKKGLIVNIFKKLTILFSNQRLACGNDAGEWLFKNNFIVLPNAIKGQNYLFSNEERNKIRKQLNIDEKCIVLGHVGRLTYQKNQKFIIKLLSLLDNQKYKAILVGDGEDKEYLMDLSKELKVDSNVYFISATSQAEKYYNAFDYFLLPSIWEGLPVVGIEAQFNGLTCLFSDRITKSICLNNNTRLISIENIELWIHNIKNIECKRCCEFDVINDYNILKYKPLITNIYRGNGD